MSAEDLPGTSGAGPGPLPGAGPGPLPDDVAGPDLARAALRAAQARARLKPSEQERMDAAARRGEQRRERRRRRTSADPVTFRAAIDALIDARGWGDEARHARVLACWGDIVGAEVAAKCRPVSLRDGELVVEAESTAWATQLRLLRGTLLARLAADLGAGVVRDVRVHGPASARPGSPGGWRVTGSQGPRDTYG